MGRARAEEALESAPFLQPRFRLVGYPIGGLRLALKLTDLLNRPIRPVDLDNPTLTVTKYRAEHWLCGRHAVEAHTGGDQIRRRITLKISRVRKPVQTALTPKPQTSPTIRSIFSGIENMG
jgi:hypothetical protein